MKRTLVTVTAAASVCALLVGCGSGLKRQDNENSTSAKVDSAKSSSSNVAHAPNVTHPVNVEEYRFKPCFLLPKASANSLNLEDNESSSIKIAGNKPAKKCDWRSSGEARESNFLSMSLIGFGLEGEYLKGKQLPEFKIEESTYVDGYPAIYVKAHGKRGGAADLIVGVNNQESISFYSAVHPASDDRAKKLAEGAASAVLRKARSGGN